MPTRAAIRHETEENLSWLGRVSAALEAWEQDRRLEVAELVRGVTAADPIEAASAWHSLLILLHHARNALRIDTAAGTSVVVAKRMVFHYFDEVRKLIEGAKQDVFFVDPYLDADFVSRYLPHIANGVTIRLLAREKLDKLLAAVDMMAQQSGGRISVRTVAGFHDRYVFVDGCSCYQSGASFKDGAKTAPTTLTQITDAFAAVLATYEGLWDQAQVQR